MPFGKAREERDKKCKRCLSTKHSAGDKSCPYYGRGERALPESFITAHEDPMYQFIANSKRREKEERVNQLKAMLDSSSSDEEERKSSQKRKHKKEKSKKRRLSDSESESTSKKHKHKHKHKKDRSRRESSRDKHHSHRKTKWRKKEQENHG